MPFSPNFNANLELEYTCIYVYNTSTLLYMQQMGHLEPERDGS